MLKIYLVKISSKIKIFFSSFIINLNKAEIKASQSEDLKLTDGNEVGQSNGNSANNPNGFNSLNSSKNQSSSLSNCLIMFFTYKIFYIEKISNLFI
jgi:hypothetical protein